jgi:hypothetical protein
MITANTCCNTAECKHETKNAIAQLQIRLAGQNASSDEHRFSATGAPDPPWLPIPQIASPAFTIIGTNLTPNSNNVWTDMAYLPATANFHPLGVLGCQQLALDFHL